MKNNTKKNNILITGGAGYIGSHIVEHLLKNKKNNIIIYDNLITGSKKLINKKAKFIRGDIKDKKYLSKVILKNQIDSIIHLAAYLNISEAEKYKKKYFKNNVYGTLNLIQSCKISKVKTIIFSSSCSVYGNVKGSVTEKSIPKPKGYYAFTKFEGEKIIKKYSKEIGYNYGILRYFNVAGASSSKKIGEIEISHGHLIKNISIQALKRKPTIKIYGTDYNTFDGTCIRDYIHVSDLSKIHIMALSILKSKKKSFIVNCGHGKGHSVKQIINVFKKIKKNVNIIEVSRRKGDVAQVYSNTTKFKKLFKWSSNFKNIESIIRSSITWERILKKKNN